MNGSYNSVKDIIQYDPKRGVNLITAGRDDLKILNVNKFNALIDIVKKDYELIILDAGVMIDDDFTHYVTTKASAVLIVGKEDDSTYKSMRNTVDRLLAIQMPAIGAVLNFSRIKRKERINNIINVQMKHLSKKHWIYHRNIRRLINNIFGYRGKRTG